jgi:hypothetical protein
VLAFIWGWFTGLLYGIPFVGGLIQGMVGGFFGIILMIIIVLGIIWIILAVGLFMDQAWAATAAMILAIVSLIVSIANCNCIGIILAIIIIWLLKD